MAYTYKKVSTARAKKTPGVSYKAVGKNPKLGTGKRFSALKSAIEKRGAVKNPAAVAAMIGQKKYGQKKMTKWATAGRKRG